jgi:hypothetical protein
MTELLTEAFKEAEKLPLETQNQLAQDVLDSIRMEYAWDQTLENSQEVLEKIADQALNDFEQGKTKQMGFDEL